MQVSEEYLPLLKACAKDEAALADLKQAFIAAQTRCSQTRHYLWLLEQIMKHDHDAIVITDIDFSSGGPYIVYVNDGFTRMTGFSREEAMGKTPRILQGPKTDRAVMDQMKRALSEGRSFFGQAVNYRKDGSEFINQWDIHPIYNEAGELTNWVSYQHDISEQKRAESTYLEQNCEFEALDEYSKRTLVDFAPDGNLLNANKAFRTLIGYEKEELLQLSIWDLICPKHVVELKQRIGAMQQPEDFDDVNIRTMLRRKCGEPVQAEICCHPHDLQDGRLIRACVNNLTLQKRIRKTLSRRNKNFAELTGKCADFSYYVSGDTRRELHFKWVSDTFNTLTGHDDGAFCKVNGWKGLIVEDDLPLLEQHLEQVFAGTSIVTEYRLRKADGTVIMVADYGKPVLDPHNGKVIAVAGIVVEVSEVLA